MQLIKNNPYRTVGLLVGATARETKIDNQVISKQRVADHGEVFTAQREVQAMLDLVKHETERIDSRFLEPACGTGNFLVEILKRKLTVVEDRYLKSRIEFDRYSLIAVASLYGIDLLEDNVIACRKRLLELFLARYQSHFKTVKKDFLRSIQFILFRNIIHGNALTLESEGLYNEPIVFSEWSLVYGNMIQRRDFKMVTLLANQPINEPNLFSDLGDDAFIPTPVKHYPLQSLYDLAEDVQSKL
ncbi:MAG: DNA methyltransferase [Bacteroidota bacterium]